MAVREASESLPLPDKVMETQQQQEADNVQATAKHIQNWLERGNILIILQMHKKSAPENNNSILLHQNTSKTCKKKKNNQDKEEVLKQFGLEDKLGRDCAFSTALW